jgi:hypothetical protein
LAGADYAPMTATRSGVAALLTGAVVLVLTISSGCAALRPTTEARGVGPPPPGPCYDASIAPRSLWAAGMPEVPCTGPHLAETYYTGTSPGPGSSAHVLPGSREMFSLFATCEEKAKEFLRHRGTAAGSRSS